MPYADLTPRAVIDVFAVMFSDWRSTQRGFTQSHASIIQSQRQQQQQQQQQRASCTYDMPTRRDVRCNNASRSAQAPRHPTAWWPPDKTTEKKQFSRWELNRVLHLKITCIFLHPIICMQTWQLVKDNSVTNKANNLCNINFVFEEQRTRNH